MMRRLLLPALILLLSAGAAWAQDDALNRAALVVVTDEETAVTRCVGFTEPQISGYELLQRSQLPLEVEVVGMGATMCSIAGAGCPADDCFCRCRGGGECVYWSYWHGGADGAWTYAQLGATGYQVSDGALEGWVWGPGTLTEASPPPAVTFGEVCGDEAVLVTAPTAARPTAAPAADGTTAPGDSSWLVYAVFLLIAAALATAVFIGRRRNQV